MDKIRLQLNLYSHRAEDIEIMKLFEGSVNPNATLRQLLYDIATNTTTQRIVAVPAEISKDIPPKNNEPEFEAIDTNEIDLF